MYHFGQRGEPGGLTLRLISVGISRRPFPGDAWGDRSA
jgi:hypothetical protein